MPSEENIVKKYIYEWFLENDSLVVPDLGKFNTSYLGAKLQPAIQKALPPNKAIFFDPDIKHDDGLLVAFVAEKEQIGQDQAEKLVRQLVTTIKAELGIHKKYTVKSLGTFVWTPEGSIGFHSDEELNYLGDSFGLPDIYNLKPKEGLEMGQNTHAFAQNGGAEVLEAKEDKGSKNPEFNQRDYEIEPDYVESSGGQAFTILISVFLLLAVVIATLLITDTNPFSLFSSSAELADNGNEEEEVPNSDAVLFDPSGEFVPADEVEDEASPNEESEAETSDRETDNTPPPPPVEDNPPVQNTNTQVVSNSSFVASFSYNPQTPANLNEVLINSKTSRYHLILGSFDKKENAFSFYNNLKARGISTSRIISPSADNPRYRVTYRGYNSRAEARNNLSSVQQRYQVNVWVLAY